MSLAAMLALGGTLGAVLAARAVARSDADHARLAFHLASAEIAASLKQAIQHEEDLVVAAGAFVRSNPRASAADFAGWSESVFAMRRYPELRNIGLAVLVPAHHLRAFEARLGAAHRAAQILPAGRRPYYCLAAAGVARSRATYVPPGLDYCALSPRLIRARDLGTSRLCAVRGGSAHGVGGGDTGVPGAGGAQNSGGPQRSVRGMAGGAAHTQRRAGQRAQGPPRPADQPALRLALLPRRVHARERRRRAPRPRRSTCWRDEKAWVTRRKAGRFRPSESRPRAACSPTGTRSPP